MLVVGSDPPHSTGNNNNNTNTNNNAEDLPNTRRYALSALEQNQDGSRGDEEQRHGDGGRRATKDLQLDACWCAYFGDE